MQAPRPGIDYLPDNFEETPAQRSRSIGLQVLAFVSIFMGLQWLWSLAHHTSVEQVAVGDCTVRTAVWMIDVLSPEIHASVSGFSIAAAGGGINVKAGCDGFEMLFLLVAGLVIAPVPWKWRLIGVLAGTPLVWLLNQVRILALFYAYRTDKGLFTLLHGTIAPLVLVVLVATLFTLFVGKISDARMSRST